MNLENHYRALERMYLAAPINRFFTPRITVSREKAEIEIIVRDAYFHAAGAVHGSVYFKMLDDAAYFAANSIETGCFVLTTAFTTYLTRPITSGRMISTGTVVNRTRSQILAESVVADGQGREIGRGNGIFVRGKTPLSDVPGYGAE